MGRVLRQTLLAPDTVEAILNGREPAEMTLAVIGRRICTRTFEADRVASDIGSTANLVYARSVT